MQSNERTGYGVCQGCGRPVDPHKKLKKWREPAARERDWTRHGYPFRPHLDYLRELYRRLAVLRAEVGRIGALLAKAQRAWPVSAERLIHDARCEIVGLWSKLDALGDKEQRPPGGPLVFK
jgi:hypothetical protein